MIAKVLLDQHLIDLKRSGLSDETIDKSGIYSASRDNAKKFLGFDPGSGGYIIPYPRRDGLPDLIHFKPDIPLKDDKGKARKYLFPLGAQSRVYVPPMIQHLALQSSRLPLYIVEGEKKALKGAQEGLICIAIPGVWNWKFRDDNGDSRCIPDLFDIWIKNRDVFICFDSDVSTNYRIALAEFELAQKLRSKGARVLGVRLPFGQNKEEIC